MRTTTLAVAATRTTPVVDALRDRAPGVLHVIDPFKVPLAEATEKARALASLGVPVLLVGSTDGVDRAAALGPYIRELKRASGLKLLTHFPPVKGRGHPVVDGADAVFGHVLLNTADAAFGPRALEMTRRWNARRLELVTSGVLTFGRDDRTFAAVAAIPIPTSAAALAAFGTRARRTRYDVVYLYSRSSPVDPRVCTAVRRRLTRSQLVFVGGGVRTRAQIHLYMRAGADYVVVGNALEAPDWRVRLASLDVAGVSVS
jgi:heptaprenylglyceryl phosphate synthase